MEKESTPRIVVSLQAAQTSSGAYFERLSPVDTYMAVGQNQWDPVQVLHFDPQPYIAGARLSKSAQGRQTNAAVYRMFRAERDPFWFS